MGFASRTYCLAAVLVALAMAGAPAASARVDTGARTVYPPVQRAVVTEAPGGFDWFSAIVGAAVASGLGLLIVGAAGVRRHGSARPSPSVS